MSILSANLSNFSTGTPQQWLALEGDEYSNFIRTYANNVGVDYDCEKDGYNDIGKNRYRSSPQKGKQNKKKEIPEAMVMYICGNKRTQGMTTWS